MKKTNNYGWLAICAVISIFTLSGCMDNSYKNKMNVDCQLEGSLRDELFVYTYFSISENQNNILKARHPYLFVIPIAPKDSYYHARSIVNASAKAEVAYHIIALGIIGENTPEVAAALKYTQCKFGGDPVPNHFDWPDSVEHFEQKLITNPDYTVADIPGSRGVHFSFLIDECIHRINSNTNSESDDSLEKLRKKANEGDAQAQYELGKKYDPSECDSIENDEEMFKWYRMSAEQGHAEAQLRLGTAFMNGTGVALNFEEAVKWFKKSAEQGLSDAQMVLGFMYSEGMGVKKDYIEAYKWNSKSAEQGNPVAQESLSRLYAHGQGVVEDYVEAYKWAILAGMQGEKASEIKDWLTERMTSEQITEAEERAKVFMASSSK